MLLSLLIVAIQAVSATAEPALKPWLPRSKQPCSGLVEDCVGTEVWCRSFIVARSPYRSPEACFKDRAAKPRSKKWTDVQSAACHGSDKECTRTAEAACEGIEDLIMRKECFAARDKGPWITPASHDCPYGTADETCLRLIEWCKTPKAKFLYGSTEVCLGFRKLAVTSWKQPSRQDNCQGDDAEECKGTESLCGRIANLDERLRCFARRQRAPFSVPYSAECPEQQTNELCNGTAAWCKESSSVKLYGSETNCRNFRDQIPEPLKWQLKAENCSDASEQCLGTEQVCNTLVPTNLRDDCFATRESPPFLSANAASCPDGKPADEGCLGTEAWCTDHFRKAKYPSAEKCLSIRGWDLKKIETQVGDGLAESLVKMLATTLIEMTASKSSFEESKPAFQGLLDNIRDNSGSLSKSAAERAFSRYIGSSSEGDKVGSQVV
ncbi:hypothetical protein CP533_2790 [Ophiocordyceps camponoti-saundersi (nom. inval.)]|nr:hypothetical protein CP533_2790 [Ophiocordyceps camponoti-saundersi (nom. inval.)]